MHDVCGVGDRVFEGAHTSGTVLAGNGWAIRLASAGEMERGVQTFKLQGWVTREKGTSTRKVRVGGKR